MLTPSTEKTFDSSCSPRVMLIENYQVNHRNNISILNNIQKEHLELSVTPGRTIGEIVQHMVITKIRWLNSIKPKIEEFEPPKEISTTSMIEVEDMILDLIAELIHHTNSGKEFGGFKSDLTGFIFYLVSHDSHHRGQILSNLSHHGKQLPPKIQYGLWEWSYDEN